MPVFRDAVAAMVDEIEDPSMLSFVGLGRGVRHGRTRSDKSMEPEPPLDRRDPLTHWKSGSQPVAEDRFPLSADSGWVYV
jgi:hypothetical protein